ncbi:MAG TPA: COX15/CtaA family protein [Pirellulaceae bacterium]|jgi:cytochrome c oxidase assembly protein subunit 15|nr:COX15/CtaA family protein [Pirellulaceae bacterium]
MTLSTEPTYSPWTHRLAVALAAVAFPVIWVGSLVTTYNAGMAVPDWPGTYGYNLFLYPWTTWIFGPWDLFVEHGHRLLASLCGLVAIVLCIVAWRNRSRRWLFWLSLGALALVIFQGILGGVRVLLDQRLVAMLHGTVGPAFFAYCVLLIALTRRSWQDAVWRPDAKAGRNGFSRTHLFVAIGFAALTLAQIGLGAGVRHLNVLATREFFVGLVVAHIAVAVALWFYAFLLFLIAFSHRAGRAPTGRALVTFLLVTMQVGFGVATWIVNYSLPDVETLAPWLARYAIEQEGLLQSYIVTAHVMFGTLILGAATTIVAFEWKPAFYAETLPAGDTASAADMSESKKRRSARARGVEAGRTNEPGGTVGLPAAIRGGSA